MSGEKRKLATRRGRPALTNSQKAVRREEIAASALRLFQTEGYNQVSMRRIASDIGCSTMTLYKYYDAKIDILRTLWGEVFANLFDSIEAIDTRDLNAPERLQVRASAYVRYWLDHTDHYRLVFMAEGVTQPEVSLFLESPDILERYRFFARDLVEAGNSPSMPTEKTGLDALICFLHGIAHNHITISGYDWTCADDLVAIALRGILAD